MKSAKQAVIELQQVSRRYRMGDSVVEAVRATTLLIHEAEFVAIHGRSGSGKSTLCNLLGLLDAPDSGTVLLQGQQVNGLRDRAISQLRNQYIGFVFQQFNLIPVLTAVENVMLPLQIGSTASGRDKTRARQLLERLGLGEHMHHRPHHLSGGQQQRVAIARALITNPKLVIADEPTANLDSRTANEIIAYMDELQQDQGITFIFATHDEDLIGRAKRRIHMNDGDICADTGSLS